MARIDPQLDVSDLGNSLYRVAVRVVAATEDHWSRRNLIRRLGRIALGVLGVNLVAPEFHPGQSGGPISAGKLNAMQTGCHCDLWWTCGMYGTLCCNSGSCAGGCGECPSGIPTSPVAWTVCCSGRQLSYYDCCDPTGAVFCNGCPFCANGSVQPNWCGPAPWNKYLCTVVSVGGTC